MPPRTIPTPAERAKSLQEEGENYQTTVHALLAFGALICHDGTNHRPGTHFGIGRRMQTSERNRVSPEMRVTPDLVAQSSPVDGVVAEVKKSLPSDRSRWIEVVNQLRKYDDSLEGWWTPDERIEHAEAVLLVHDSRSRALVNLIRDDSSNLLGPHSAIVEFGRSDESKVFIRFRLELGEIHNLELKQLIQEGVAVPVQKVLASYATLKFYDSKPAVENLMSLLWLDAFVANRDRATHDDESGHLALVVRVDELTSELQLAYGSHALEIDARSSPFPRPEWIREALDEFVKIGLARHTSEDGSYLVLLRDFGRKEDILLRLCKLRARQPAEHDSGDGQLNLLDTE